MPPSKLDLLKVRVHSYKATLENATPAQKQQHASIALTDNFNTLLKEIAETFPDLKDTLPAPIHSHGPGARVLHLSDISFLDLEIFADQTLRLLELIDEG